MHRPLTKSLGLAVNHLLWVPHSLTATPKAECVTFSNELLCLFRSTEHQSWQFIITCDESWFYLSAEYGHIWLCPGGQSPERPRHMIQKPKMMLTSAWNPLQFHFLGARPKGRIWNAE
jgi:hypothetical protein